MTVEEIKRVIQAYYKTNAVYRKHGEGKAYELIHADMEAYYNHILEYYNFLLEEGNATNMVTNRIRISGTVDKPLDDNKDYSRILVDQGGVVTLRDWHLEQAGFNEGDRVTITIEPCGKDEFYYQSTQKRQL